MVPVIGLIVIMSLVGLTQLIGEQPAAMADDMVYISAGSFTMGSDQDDAPPDTRPAHQVDLDAYWIDRDEVTNWEYQEFLEATEHPLPLLWHGKYPAGRDDLPVAGATWSDAVAYCSFVGKRLPGLNGGAESINEYGRGR
jgi:formylglycine-generating enzyme required for sulfatase activity